MRQSPTTAAVRFRMEWDSDDLIEAMRRATSQSEQTVDAQLRVMKVMSETRSRLVENAREASKGLEGAAREHRSRIKEILADPGFTNFTRSINDEVSSLNARLGRNVGDVQAQVNHLHSAGASELQDNLSGLEKVERGWKDTTLAAQGYWSKLLGIESEIGGLAKKYDDLREHATKTYAEVRKTFVLAVGPAAGMATAADVQLSSLKDLTKQGKISPAQVRELPRTFAETTFAKRGMPDPKDLEEITTRAIQQGVAYKDLKGFLDLATDAQQAYVTGASEAADLTSDLVVKLGISNDKSRMVMVQAQQLVKSSRIGLSGMTRLLEGSTDLAKQFADPGQRAEALRQIAAVGAGLSNLGLEGQQAADFAKNFRDSLTQMSGDVPRLLSVLRLDPREIQKEVKAGDYTKVFQQIFDQLHKELNQGSPESQSILRQMFEGGQLGQDLPPGWVDSIRAGKADFQDLLAEAQKSKRFSEEAAVSMEQNIPRIWNMTKSFTRLSGLMFQRPGAWGVEKARNLMSGAGRLLTHTGSPGEHALGLGVAAGPLVGHWVAKKALGAGLSSAALVGIKALHKKLATAAEAEGAGWLASKGLGGAAKGLGGMIRGYEKVHALKRVPVNWAKKKAAERFGVQLPRFLGGGEEAATSAAGGGEAAASTAMGRVGSVVADAAPWIAILEVVKGIYSWGKKFSELGGFKDVRALGDILSSRNLEFLRNPSVATLPLLSGMEDVYKRVAAIAAKLDEAGGWFKWILTPLGLGVKLIHEFDFPEDMFPQVQRLHNILTGMALTLQEGIHGAAESVRRFMAPATDFLAEKWLAVTDRIQSGWEAVRSAFSAVMGEAEILLDGVMKKVNALLGKIGLGDGPSSVASELKWWSNLLDPTGTFEKKGAAYLANQKAAANPVREPDRAPSLTIPSSPASRMLASQASVQEGLVPRSRALAATPSSYQDLVDAAAQKYGIPASLIASVLRTESAGKRGAVSGKGAAGLMQVMPNTAREMGYGGARDMFDPAKNIDAGSHYLSLQMKKYHGNAALAAAAYNAGPGAVDKFGGVPPYRETQGYVRSVLAGMSGAGTGRGQAEAVGGQTARAQVAQAQAPAAISQEEVTARLDETNQTLKAIYNQLTRQGGSPPPAPSARTPPSTYSARTLEAAGLGT